MQRRVIGALLGVLLAVPVVFSGATAEAAPVKSCALPASGSAFETASPGQEAIDPAAVDAAVTYAQTQLRASVQIFRDNCKIGQGLADPVTDQLPMEIFSATKSVVSILTGIAYDQHKIGLDDPIGKYLPPGLGDAAHRAITVRQLLTETSGLDEAILSEFATVGTDPDVVQEALAQPLTHRPGTHFEYSQRTPDLLAAVVQSAVGEDLQDFAQTYLFGPLGIDRHSYVWLRDRAGNTYGYANLFIPPAQFAKLGLLTQNGGTWRGKRIVSAGYLTRARANTPTNPCYGFLFWHNGGDSCTSANIPAAQTVRGPLIGSAPSDLFAMVGALQQNNFMIPSLHMTVTWTGAFGDTAPNLAGLLSAAPGADLYYNFFRILLRGVRDVHVPDPGPYRTPPLDLDVNPVNYLDPAVLLRDVAPNSHCTILVCTRP
ncbi:serine hydrolase domain-containing protein [Amycolatopsis alkalitolerans]|uniref:Serine hydrolase n=1 Tax=Amycolatopsis alkalitolerans TaxID=2547244 RepID=A0A5C4M9R0_9PSEU|nr:serine hydrolase [Amycolatopsis alkalitolerans]TNC29664.1 serine hydrolase [Amycolatopsis alkalitolerans]